MLNSKGKIVKTLKDEIKICIFANNKDYEKDFVSIEFQRVHTLCV